MDKVNSEQAAQYSAAPTVGDDEIIAKALEILAARVASGPVLESPKSVMDWLTLQYGGEKRELFAVLFLDNRHRLITSEVLSIGTIDSASVYPREVLRRALELNAAALVLTHNHPSGDATPSTADQAITRRIIDACKLVDIRVLDHIVTGSSGSVSFAEKGLL